MEQAQNYWIIALKLLGSLGLLIYGMRMMSEALQKMAGAQLRHVLGTMTTNRFTGMLTGAFVTCAVQSSSATTVMTVSFASAGLLTLSQAISVIMGANIGTTLTAWIMSLGYNVDLTNIVFPAFTIGMFLIYKKRHRFTGDFLFGIAFMFLSLVLLSETGREMRLEHNKAVVDFFASFDTNSHLTIVIFLLIGTLITCVVQSSAAVMAITILLCSTGVLPIYLGIALVMGENIGTTATANFAALGSNREARRTALAHLLFNVFGVVWVLCIFYFFVDIVCSLVGYNPAVGGQAEKLPVVLAMFHTCFNVANTSILIWFVPQIEHVVRRILPEEGNKDKEDVELRYIQANLVQTPEILVLQAQKETIRFGEYVESLFELTRRMLNEKDEEEFDKLYVEVERQEDITDKTECAIAHYLGEVSDNHLSDETKMKIRQMMREIGELESIGDVCYKLARVVERGVKKGSRLSEQQYVEVNKLAALCDKALKQMNLVMHEANHENIKETFRIENEINSMRNELKNKNILAVNEKKYDYTVGTMFADIVNELEKLGDYVVNVVQARYAK